MHTLRHTRANFLHRLVQGASSKLQHTTACSGKTHAFLYALLHSQRVLGLLGVNETVCCRPGGSVHVCLFRRRKDDKELVCHRAI